MTARLSYTKQSAVVRERRQNKAQVHRHLTILRRTKFHLGNVNLMNMSTDK